MKSTHHGKLAGALLGIFALVSTPLWAAWVDHFDESENYATIDNDGGNDESYYFDIDDVGVLSESNFAIWDDTEGTFYEGGDDDDFAGTGSAILLIQPTTGLGEADEATGRQASPFLPVTFSADPYLVEQATFARNRANSIVIVYKVTNTSDTARRTKVMFANDWDMQGPVSADVIGFVGGLRMVYQQDTFEQGETIYTGGAAVIKGSYRSHWLGDCCDLTDPDEDDLAEDFVTGVLSGDQITSSDREIALLVDFGTLEPGETGCSAWAYGLAKGANPDQSLGNLQSSFEDSIALYNTIPEEFTCGRVADSTAIPALSMSGKLALLGGMLLMLMLVGARRRRR